MKKKKYRILVTGADGFIGSHLTERLVKQGHQVSAFTFYNSFGLKGWLDYSNNKIKNKIKFISGDIRDNQAVRSAVKGIDIIYHLAALIGIPHSYTSAESYVDTNVKGTLNVLMAAREYNIKKIIHTSTSEVYGTARFVPISEEHPILGQSPYSASKIAADQMAYSFFASFDLPVVIARPFNTYGPRQSARAVIPTIISQLACGERKIKLGSISPTRDFNYVEDTVSGFIAALEGKGILGEVINFGSNFEISIGDTVKLISEIMDVEVEIITDGIRIRPQGSEVERLWADNSKAKKLLGWTPKYAGKNGFKNGLSNTIKWFTDPQNLSFYKSNLYNL